VQRVVLVDRRRAKRVGHGELLRMQSIMHHATTTGQSRVHAACCMLLVACCLLLWQGRARTSRCLAAASTSASDMVHSGGHEEGTRCAGAICLLVSAWCAGFERWL